ncbi:MAG: hypothetical protein BMS9Abin02_0871 [Anaerolineae bacterium]|nr:MAG: hypothetical protein BMS9Abin02_0871 [Anaerolineae bacterium]
MTGILPGTIIPWLLGGLILLLLLTITVTYKSWREAKRSPYYFLRVQAARKMQSYMAASALLLVLTGIATMYAWQSPTDTTPRLTVLLNAKPTSSLSVGAPGVQEVVAEASPDIVTINIGLDGEDSIDSEVELAESIITAPNLGDEPGEREATGGSSGETNIGPITFSTDITSNYQAVDPGSRFTEGYFTLYATFNYENMEEGTRWSWVWKRNGQVINGGEQVWSYGSDGPGYVYLGPEEGFQLGNHSLEVWVEDKLMSQSSFSIIEGVSASN